MHGTRNNPDTARIFRSIGWLYQQKRDYKLAKHYFMKSLGILCRLYGRASEEKCNCNSPTPTCCDTEGDWNGINENHGAEVEWEWRYLLTLTCRCYNNVDHKDIAGILLDLGFNSYLARCEHINLYYRYAVQEESEKLLKDAGSMFKRLGILSKVANTLRNRGVNLSEMENFSEANSCFFHSLVLYQDIYGSNVNNIDVATALKDMGINFLAQHEVNCAQLYLQNGLDMYESLDLGRNVAERATCQLYLGKIFDLQQKYTEAEIVYRNLLQVAYSLSGGECAKHVDIAGMLYFLGRNLHYQMRYDEAGVLLEEALEMYDEVFGKFDKENVSLLHVMGKNLLEQQRYEEADKYLYITLEEMRKIYGNSDNEAFAELSKDIGTNHYYRQRFKAAEHWLKHCCLEQYEYLPPLCIGEKRLEDMASALYGLFLLYRDTKDNFQANENAKKALDIYKQINPRNRNVPALVAFMDRVEI